MAKRSHSEYTLNLLCVAVAYYDAVALRHVAPMLSVIFVEFPPQWLLCFVLVAGNRQLPIGSLVEH